MRRVSVCMLLLASGVLFAQHSYTPAEIEEGRRLYQTRCGNCHGVNGDGVSGLNFARNQFRRAASDEDIVRIIRTGIPGTAMQAFSFSEQQAGTLVAYLRNMGVTTADRGSAVSSLPPGETARGKAIFEGKGDCLKCHRVNGNGSRLGPDLSTIGAPAPAPARGAPPVQSGSLLQQLERALVDPTADVRAEHRTYRVVTRDGSTITGRLMNQDTYSVQLLDSAKENLVSLPKSNLREFGFLSSPMPSYRDRLTRQELADVASYLISLKGPQ